LKRSEKYTEAQSSGYQTLILVFMVLSFFLQISIAFPDDGSWKRFHKQLQHFPMVILFYSFGNSVDLYSFATRSASIMYQVQLFYSVSDACVLLPPLSLRVENALEAPKLEI